MHSQRYGASIGDRLLGELGDPIDRLIKAISHAYAIAKILADVDQAV